MLTESSQFLRILVQFPVSISMQTSLHLSRGISMLQLKRTILRVTLAIAEIIVHAGGQTVTPVLGAEFSLDIVLENLSSSEILSQADALITFSDAISPSSLDVTIPAMGPETVTLTDMHLIASGFDAGNAIVGKFEGVGSIEVVRNFAVEIHIPSFSIAFDNQVHCQVINFKPR